MRQFLLLFLVSAVNCGKWRAPNYHVATDNQMVIRQDNGGVKFGVDLGDTYRSETRTPSGLVQGVYSWNTPSGKPVTIAYANDKANNYQTLPFDALGVSLPAFPYSLYNNDAPAGPIVDERGEELKPYGALAPEKRYPETVDDDAVVVDAQPQPTLYSNGHFNGAEEWVTQGLPFHVNSENRQEDEVDDLQTIIPAEPEEDNAVFVGEGEQQGPGGFPGGPPIPSDVIPVPVPPGTPVAQSLPSASAVAGPLGLSQATPAASAQVGPGGVAIAFPTGEAIVGPGGVAISRPQAGSQAGFGGVAIAGGQSIAVSIPGEIPAVPGGDGAAAPVGADEAGFETAKDGSLYGMYSNGNFAAYPIVANYFFNNVDPSTFADILKQQTNRKYQYSYQQPYYQELSYNKPTVHYQQRYQLPAATSAYQPGMFYQPATSYQELYTPYPQQQQQAAKASYQGNQMYTAYPQQQQVAKPVSTGYQGGQMYTAYPKQTVNYAFTYQAPEKAAAKAYSAPSVESFLGQKPLAYGSYKQDKPQQAKTYSAPSVESFLGQGHQPLAYSYQPPQGNKKVYSAPSLEAFKTKKNGH